MSSCLDVPLHVLLRDLIFLVFFGISSCVFCFEQGKNFFPSSSAVGFNAMGEVLSVAMWQPDMQYHGQAVFAWSDPRKQPLESRWHCCMAFLHTCLTLFLDKGNDVRALRNCCVRLRGAAKMVTAYFSHAPTLHMSLVEKSRR